MKDGHSMNSGNKPESNKSANSRYKPVIFGMGGGVLFGIIMGNLLKDPALGMVFGLSMGSGYWYMLKNKNTK